MTEDAYADSGGETHARKGREFMKMALRQGTDSLQSATAISERQYVRAAKNQGAVLRSSCKMLLLLAELRGSGSLSDGRRRTLEHIAGWDPED